MMKELNVRVGDKVLYQYSYISTRTERIETVKKVTPTGRIRVKGTDKQFDKYGREMGGNSWGGRATLSIPTLEDFQRIEENETISKALSMMAKLNIKTLPYEKALKIIDILEESEEK